MPTTNMEEEKLLPSAPPEPLLPRAGVAAPKTPRSARRGIMVGVIALIVVAATSVWALGYFVLQWSRKPLPRKLTDSEIVYAALLALPDIKSGSVRFELSFKAEPREPGVKPLTAEIAGIDERRKFIQQDSERLQEISIVMQQLESRVSFWRSSQAAGMNMQEPLYPTTLEDIIFDGDDRTDPSGTSYSYWSDGNDFRLTFRLETKAGVEAWNGQLDGSRAWGEFSPPPRAAINQDITLTSAHQTPAVYLSVDDADALAGFDLAYAEMFKSLPAAFAASFDFTSEFNASDPTAKTGGDAKVSLGGQVMLGDLTFAGAGELRKVGENLYGWLQKFPLPPIEGIDFGAIKGKWVKVTPEDLVGSGIPLDVIDAAAQGKDMAKSQAVALQHYRLFLRLAQEHGLITIAQTLPPVPEESGTYRRYQITLDRTKFVEFYRTLTQQAKADFGSDALVAYDAEVAAGLEREEFTTIYEALAKNMVAEVWVHAGTNLPRKFSYSLRLVPPDNVARLAETQFRLTAAVVLDQVNQPVNIETPSPVISVDEATALVTSQPPSVVTLQRQLRNVEAIRSALTRYQLRAGQYPETLGELKRKPSEVPWSASSPAPPEPRKGIIRHGMPLGSVIPDDAAPFLKVVPNDVYTKQPYPYQREGDGYVLRYQVRLPPKAERTGPDLYSRIDYHDYREGENTADAQTMSREADAAKDSDGDGLSDVEEAKYGTDPRKADTDGDGYTDGVEVKNGFNPKGPGRLPAISTGPLLQIITSGGLCPDGNICRGTITINHDGSVSTGDLRLGTTIAVNAKLLTELRSAITQADFAAIRAKPFTGVCPTAWDDIEVTYVFYTSHGQETVASCQTAIDARQPLFQTSQAVWTAVQQAQRAQAPFSGCAIAYPPVERAAYDQQRLARIKQIQTAVELYFNDQNRYPIAEQPLSLGKDVTCLDDQGFHAICRGVVYMSCIPADPDDGVFRYTVPADATMQYCIEFSLDQNLGTLRAGKNYASENGIFSDSCRH